MKESAGKDPRIGLRSRIAIILCLAFLSWLLVFSAMWIVALLVRL